MKNILKLLPFAIILLVSAITDAAAKEKKPFIGLSAHAVRNIWEDLYVKAFDWYAEDIGVTTTWSEAGYDTSLQIKQAERLIDMGIDGLIISPWNVEALRVVMDYAKEKGVPVMTTNTAVNHSYPLMHVGYGAKRGAKELGEKIVEYLKNEVEPIGEVRGNILELSSGVGTSEEIMRGGGFHEVVDKYRGIKVITQIAESSREQAKIKTLKILRSGVKINAIFAQNGSMALGACSALKSYKDINPKDIYIATVDAFPDILKEIEAGYIDIALDQPPAFYNPIALHYMCEYLKRGDSALPGIGETITADKLVIGIGKKHLGVDPWEKPVWAPAKIKHMTEYSEEIENDYLWFETNAVFVTKENCKSPLLWGNFPLPGW
jgi:ABC-type sugar transport system substrate-binding protein